MSSAVIRISSYEWNATAEDEKRLREMEEKAKKEKEKELSRYEAFRQSLRIEQHGRRGISHIYDEHPLREIIVNERREYKTLKESVQIEMP